jgi:hypothetical protein
MKAVRCFLKALADARSFVSILENAADEKLVAREEELERDGKKLDEAKRAANLREEKLTSPQVKVAEAELPRATRDRDKESLENWTGGKRKRKRKTHMIGERDNMMDSMAQATQHVVIRYVDTRDKTHGR